MVELSRCICALSLAERIRSSVHIQFTHGNSGLPQHQKTGDCNGGPYGKLWVLWWNTYAARFICRRLRWAEHRERSIVSLWTGLWGAETTVTFCDYAWALINGSPTVQSRPLRMTFRYSVSRSTGMRPASRMSRCSKSTVIPSGVFAPASW